MEGSPFLPLPEGMVIDQVQITETQLTVIAISTQPQATCPGCGRPSEHVHSHYQRTVNDVPCGGRNVVLRLGVRKFFCRTATCPRKVFAERLPDLVQPWARVSNRLFSELKAIGLAASAEVSERLTPQLGMKVKAPTLLRYLRTIPPPPKTNITVLGIDDFALRRGDKYGTILGTSSNLVRVLQESKSSVSAQEMEKGEHSWAYLRQNAPHTKRTLSWCMASGLTAPGGAR